MYCVRELITEISQSSRPLALHNGFIDLIFLYQNFYAKCPESLMKFLADVEEIFSGGLYDTKYIADFHEHSAASFLEYLYKKALYNNTQAKLSQSNKHLVLDFDNSMRLSDFKMDTFKPTVLNKQEQRDKLCATYSVYGFCTRIETCSKSHDINLIIQTELNSASRKKRSKLKSKSAAANDANNAATTSDSASVQVEENTKQNQSHSAGIDAFMTGFVLLNYVNKFTKFKVDPSESLMNSTSIQFSRICSLESHFKNNIYLVGKDYPLIVCKSNFASISLNHKEKKERNLEKLNTLLKL